jgi:hypothetical protein
MRWLAATESIRRSTLGQDVLSFAGIRNVSLISRQRWLEKEGASDSEQLVAAKARIKMFEDQSAQYQSDLDFFDSEHKREEARAEAAEEQARAYAFRIQQLLGQIKASGQPTETSIDLPKSWADFANWCDLNLSGRVALSPLARRGVRSPEFEEFQTAARCLLWLANEYYDRRVGCTGGSLRDEAIGDGIRNAHCGGDQFDLDWQGQRYTADWHIKNGGNTRDPRRCLRIYILLARNDTADRHRGNARSQTHGCHMSLIGRRP